jgi:hypothetical protein
LVEHKNEVHSYWNQNHNSIEFEDLR